MFILFLDVGSVASKIHTLYVYTLYIFILPGYRLHCYSLVLYNVWIACFTNNIHTHFPFISKGLFLFFNTIFVMVYILSIYVLNEHKMFFIISMIDDNWIRIVLYLFAHYFRIHFHKYVFKLLYGFWENNAYTQIQLMLSSYMGYQIFRLETTADLKFWIIVQLHYLFIIKDDIRQVLIFKITYIIKWRRKKSSSVAMIVLNNFLTVVSSHKGIKYLILSSFF